ncbi:MAG TPA: hypothetical protein VLY24_19700 [Bryobacteraceae bacterium]|nr:hypothetical protein [Bryobacteraceae bacterium]
MFRFRDPKLYLLILVFANAVTHADVVAQILDRSVRTGAGEAAVDGSTFFPSYLT